MKRSTLLSMAITGILYVSLAGYQSGPAANGEGNRTTSGTNATCSGGGCHGVNNSNTNITITLKEGASTVTNGQYKPNTLYNVTITAANTAVNLAKYGLQFTAVTASNMQAGILSASGILHTSMNNTGGLTVVEHNTAIPSVSGLATSPAFSWVSPGSGGGTVTFHVIVNAVNGNNFSDTGDHASTASFSFAEDPLSVSTVAASIKIQVYPNPVSNVLNIRLDGNVGYTASRIQVLNILGNLVFDNTTREKWNSINTALWAKGIYMVTVSSNGANAIRNVVIR